MKFIDISGTCFEAVNDKLIVRKKNGKTTEYEISNMLYPSDIKDGLFGNCSFLIKFSDKKIVQVLCKMDDKEELEKFWLHLGMCYSRIASKDLAIYKNNINKNKNNQISIKLIQCPCCGREVSEMAKCCPNCGQPINENPQIKQEEKPMFNGVYRKTMFSGLQEVRCPRCSSENCSHYKEQKIIPGKTKTRYAANLNPLKPFTLVNKKEKVVKKEETVTENKFICNSCGKIFY